MAISRMRRYAKVIAFLAICTVGISGCGRERGAAELPFLGHGTLKRWRSFQKCIQERPKMEWRKRIYMIPKILSDMSWSILQIISG